MEISAHVFITEQVGIGGSFLFSLSKVTRSGPGRNPGGQTIHLPSPQTNFCCYWWFSDHILGAQLWESSLFLSVYRNWRHVVY